jgi:S-DNA-T family DNA segregation ATPase FtsK/SpoIIIE
MAWMTSPGAVPVFVLVLWLVLGAALRGRYPVGYWYVVGYPLLWVRITRTWRQLALERGLTVSKRGGQTVISDLIVRGQDIKPRIPWLRIGLPTRTGLVIRARMLPGQVPEQYADAALAMMHAWRVSGVRVVSPGPGQLEIRVFTSDPLAGVVVRDPDAVAASPALPGPGLALTAGEVLLSLLVGVTEQSGRWVMDLRALPHWLVVGRTRSGKSTLIHSLVSRLAPLPVALVGIDLKGGLELAVYGPRLSGLATTRTEALAVLEALMTELTDRMARCRAAGVRAVWELPEPPVPVVIVIDEVAELFLVSAKAEQAERDQVAALLLRLAQLGAALDVHLIVGGQRFGSDLGPGATALRAQLVGRVCMSVSDPETAVMVLGDLWPEAVAAAQMLTAEQRGMAVTSDGAGSWMRARATLTSAEEAAETARACAGLTPVLRGITGPYDGRGGDGA